MKNININAFNDVVVAKDKTTIYTVKVFSDGSSALYYNNGYTVGHWCNIKGLKAHINHLSCITKKNFIDEWEILNYNFFECLGII